MEPQAEMYANPAEINDLSELRNFVQQKICEHNELELNAFQLTERILVRGGRPCGIFFCLYGPRSVKLTAIWETDRNTILFYGSSGQRQHRAYLQHAPKLAGVA
jgi:hypothetical protein